MVVLLGELQRASVGRRDNDSLLFFFDSNLVLVPWGPRHRLLHPLGRRGHHGHGAHTRQPTTLRTLPSSMCFYGIFVIVAGSSRTCLWIFAGLFPQGSLSWSSDKAQPGGPVSLTATALEPKSVLGVVVTETQDDAPPADLKAEQVWSPVLICQKVYRGKKFISFMKRKIASLKLKADLRHFSLSLWNTSHTFPS